MVALEERTRKLDRTTHKLQQKFHVLDECFRKEQEGSLRAIEILLESHATDAPPQLSLEEIKFPYSPA